MDTPELEKQYIEAGREYLSALETLGLDVDALFWGFDTEIRKHVLVLVTDFFDFKGPLEISKQLFRAYNASVTPKEIDPFVVRMHSVNHSKSEEILAHASGDWRANVFDRDHKPKIKDLEYSSITIDGLEIRPEWVIFARKHKRRTSVEVNRRWRRFARNIEAAAA